MYNYKKCIEVSDDTIYDVFKGGFSDYITPFRMTKDQLIGRFFGVEGNKRELSFIAFDGKKPVGIMLGGIKKGEIFKTLRCGAMALIPEVRGLGVAKELFKLHKDLAKSLECKQLFLEVIEGNDRAINFYNKMGYEKEYNLSYMYLDIDDNNKKYFDKCNNLSIEVLNYNDIYSLRKNEFSHLPWQACFYYFDQLPCKYYGIKINDKIIAGLVGTENIIYYLWVYPEHRTKGYASALISRLISDTNTNKLNIMFTNNSQIHMFCKHIGMKKSDINQFEMYMLI